MREGWPMAVSASVGNMIHFSCATENLFTKCFFPRVVGFSFRSSALPHHSAHPRTVCPAGKANDLVRSMCDQHTFPCCCCSSVRLRKVFLTLRRLQPTLSNVINNPISFLFIIFFVVVFFLPYFFFFLFMRRFVRHRQSVEDETRPMCTSTVVCTVCTYARTLCVHKLNSVFNCWISHSVDVLSFHPSLPPSPFTFARDGRCCAIGQCKTGCSFFCLSWFFAVA